MNPSSPTESSALAGDRPCRAQCQATKKPDLVTPGYYSNSSKQFPVPCALISSAAGSIPLILLIQNYLYKVSIKKTRLPAAGLEAEFEPKRWVFDMCLFAGPAYQVIAVEHGDLCLAGEIFDAGDGRALAAVNRVPVFDIVRNKPVDIRYDGKDLFAWRFYISFRYAQIVNLLIFLSGQANFQGEGRFINNRQAHKLWRQAGRYAKDDSQQTED